MLKVTMPGHFWIISNGRKATLKNLDFIMLTSMIRIDQELQKNHQSLLLKLCVITVFCLD